MTTKQRTPEPSAVVWVDADHAIVASTDPDGGIATEKVDRGAQSETEYLAHVVHEIGDRPTVSVVGPSSVRIALEREFVAVNQRPDRLVGIPISARVAEAWILERMRRLAA
jgi:hypothetical protein